MTDGKTWHLEKRCSAKTKEMFLALDKILQDKFEIDGRRWNQKHYISYRINNYNWLAVITSSGILRLDILAKAGVFKTDDLAKKLGIAKFEKEDSFSEKLGLPTSVSVKNRNENTDRIRVRIKEDFKLESAQFLSFLEEAYKAFPK